MTLSKEKREKVKSFFEKDTEINFAKWGSIFVYTDELTQNQKERLIEMGYDFVSARLAYRNSDNPLISIQFFPTRKN